MVLRLIRSCGYEEDTDGRKVAALYAFRIQRYVRLSHSDLAEMIELLGP